MASFDAWVIDPFPFFGLPSSVNVAVFVGSTVATVSDSYDEGFDTGYDVGYGDGYVDGENAGEITGYADGYLDANHNDYAYAGAEIVVTASDYAGAPVTGLTPTWSAYYNAVTGVAGAGPAIVEIGGGHYRFAPTGTAPAGILNLGAATPRYFLYASISSAYVFIAYDDQGQPLAGLTPVWVNLKKVSDGSNMPQPALTPLGGGLYKTQLFMEHVVGVIDLGEDAWPRYTHYDSESYLGPGFAIGYAYGREDTNMLEVVQNVDKLVSTRLFNAATGLPEALIDTVGVVVQLKKAGGAFSTITPTLTIRNTYLDIALVGITHLDTLGIADVTIDAPGRLPAQIKLNVGIDKVAAINANTNSQVSTAITAINAHTDTDVATAISSINTNTDNEIAAAVTSINANVDAAETSINTNVDNAVIEINAHTDAALAAMSFPTADAVRDAVLDALLSDHAIVGSVADGIAVAAGLLQGNFMMDNVDNTNPNGQTAARMRIWRSAAAMASATSGGSGAQGAFATFTVETSYEGPNKILSHKVTRV